MRKRFIWIGIIVALLILFPIFLKVYGNLLWFESLSFSSIFWKIILTKIEVFFGFGILFFVLLWLNLRIALKEKVYTQVIPYPISIKSLILSITIFLAFIAGMNMVSKWAIFLKYFNRVPFNFSDPIFHRDISFYVFSLPFYQLIKGWLLSTLVIIAIFTTILYFYERAIFVTPMGLEVRPIARRHLLILGGIFFFIIAWAYWLSMYGLLYSTRGVVFGAGYTDTHAQVPAFWILIVLSVICGGSLIFSSKHRGWKPPTISISSLIGAMLIVGLIYPGIVQQLIVKPNEITREAPYIENNIKFTRMAYDIENVEQFQFPAMQNITMRTIEENKPTLSNIRLWDERPLKQTYKQLQEIRLYYDFKSVDVDRYTINGKYRSVMLSGRELASPRLPPNARTWINLHLKYTHGYGLCMSPVNIVTEEGLPQFIIKDIPPISENIRSKRPEIYYGEETEEYAIVNTKTEEFDYPMGNKNKYTRYEGRGGVRIGSLFRKFIFAVEFGDIKILLTHYIDKNSRIMFHRSILERVKTIAPFLSYDRDPYLVIAKGKLYWILDAYTTTSDFPYSEPYGNELNYIRNSVKVVIDAYNGKVTFYLFDFKDPLVNVYKKIFPRLFIPFNNMPESLKKHIRYPRDLFMIQASVYRTYHMQDPQVFYNREDLFSIPNEIYGEQSIQMIPYYTIMRLPGEERECFILMLPYTPSNKENMVAWMCARCDYPDYGGLVVYRLPKEKLIFGPMQVEARISQNPEISRELTLWGQMGSRAIRGNLLVIPIKDAFIYVEPVYLQATESEVPELKRVIVSYSNTVKMNQTLNGALNSIFGGKILPEAKPVQAPGQTINNLLREAMRHYKEAKSYLMKWDWRKSGSEFDSLETTLKRLLERSK